MNNLDTIKSLMKSAEEYGLPVTLDHCFGKNIRIKIGFDKATLEQSIDELALSVRSQNALKRANIMTLDELVDALNAGDLRRIRNLGTKSYREIQTKILVYGYERASEKGRQEFFKNVLDLNAIEH